MPPSRQNERPYGFSPHVIAVLKQAGWFEGRDVLGCLVLPAQYPLFQQARSILAEFGELHVGAIAPGIECATSDVVFDPTSTAHLAEDIRRHQETLGIKLYPLGEVHCGHAYLIIDEQGTLYLLNDTLLTLAASFAAALEKLLLGRAPGND